MLLCWENLLLGNIVQVPRSATAHLIIHSKWIPYERDTRTHCLLRSAKSFVNPVLQALLNLETRVFNLFNVRTQCLKLHFSHHKEISSLFKTWTLFSRVFYWHWIRSSWGLKICLKTAQNLGVLICWQYKKTGVETVTNGGQDWVEERCSYY